MPRPHGRCKSSRNGPPIAQNREKSLKIAEICSFLAACASPPRRAATFPTFAGLWAGSTFNMCQHLVVRPPVQHTTYVPTFASEWCQHSTKTVMLFLSTFPQILSWAAILGQASERRQLRSPGSARGSPSPCPSGSVLKIILKITREV